MTDNISRLGARESALKKEIKDSSGIEDWLF
jgi:hypothetical protein